MMLVSRNTDWYRLIIKIYPTHNTSSTVVALLISGGHTEHEEQVAKVTLQRSVCIIPWVQVSSSEVTQWLLWVEQHFATSDNDEFSAGFQSLKERGEGAARRRRTSATTYSSNVAVNVFIKDVLQKSNEVEKPSLQTIQICLTWPHSSNCPVLCPACGDGTCLFSIETSEISRSVSPI